MRLIESQRRASPGLYMSPFEFKGFHYIGSNVVTTNAPESRLGRKFHPGIYQWNLPVFPGMANKAKVANTGKYNFLPQNIGKYDF